jgi:hypothetical protein
VGNILRRSGIAPAPKRGRQMNWANFIRSHMAVLAGVDFFTVEVLTWRGLATYYVLFFLHLETRRITLAGLTRHPTEDWMVQMARTAVDAIDGALLPVRFVLHDRDHRIPGALPSRTQPPRRTKCSALPGLSAVEPTLCSSVSSAFRWLAQVL